MFSINYYLSKSNYLKPKQMKTILGILCAIVLVSTSCTKKVTVAFKPIPPDIIVLKKLEDFMKANINPSIVLRVPGGASNSTSSQLSEDIQIYNTIEKALLKNGFTVRDRALFSEVLNKTIDSDYSKISVATKTDLILDMVSIKQEKHVTNKYLDKYSDEKLFGCNKEYTFIGYSIEFKLILLEKNEFVGSYKFYITPCTNGCDYIQEKDPFMGRCRLKTINSSSILNNETAFEIIESSEKEKMVIKFMDEFISKLRK